MKRKLFSLAFVSLSVFLFLGCQEKIDDPGKKDNGPVDQGELVAVNGFYTIEHEEFTFKIREEVYDTPAAKSAMDLLKKNLSEINSLLPEKALKVMHKNPIWLEKVL